MLVVPAHPGKGRKKQIAPGNEAEPLFAKKRGMTWAQRLIEDPVVIKKRHAHLTEQVPATIKYVMPEGRSPPKSSLLAD